MPDVQITEAEATELRGKGIDILTSHVVESTARTSESNHPVDIEAATKAKTDADATAKAEAEAKAAEEAKAKKPEGDEQNGVQKRINELTKARREAERKAQADADRAARLEAENKALREQAAAGNRGEAEAKEPKREDFDDNEAYIAARVKFETAAQAKQDAEARAKREASEKAAREQEDAKKRGTEAAEKVAERFEAQQEAARAKHTDYDDVTSNQDIVLRPELALATLHSEQGGELLYHFGKNPDVVERLNGLDQASMLKELGKIELALTQVSGGQGAGDQPRKSDGTFAKKDGDKPKGKEVSSASAPIDPVGGSGEGAAVKDPSKMSMAEYVAARESGKLK